MKWLVVGLIGLVVSGGLAWRCWWLHLAAKRATTCIPNFRYRPGMEKFDPDLRDQTTARRQEHEAAITDFKRQLTRPKTKLHRVS